MIKYFSVMFIESILTERIKVGDDGDGMVLSLLDYPCSLAPLSGDGVVFQDLIKIVKTVKTS